MAPKSAPKVSNLSEEYIQDSDEDDKAETANVATPKSSPAKTSAKQSAGSSNIDKVAQQAKTPLEREEVDGEEEEDGEEDDGEEEDDDDEEVAEVDEEDGEDDEPGAAGMVAEAADDRPRASPKASKKPKAVASVSRNVPANPFEPPTGFEKLEVDLSNGDSRHAELLSSGIAGKQIWHITAPSDVSISTIKKFKIDSKAKSSTMEIEGKPYSFTAGSASNKVLLNLDSNEHDYRPAKGSVSRTYHIQEVFNPLLPRDDAGESPTKKMRFTVESTIEVAVRPIRQQPAGLGLHFTAVGVVDDSNGKTGAKDAGKDKFHVPPALPSPSPSTGGDEPEPRSDAQRRAEAEESTDSDQSTDSGAEVQPQREPEAVKGKAKKQKQVQSTSVPTSTAKEHREQEQDEAKRPQSGTKPKKTPAARAADTVPGKKKKTQEKQGQKSSAQTDAASNKKPDAMDLDERPAILPPGHVKSKQPADAMDIDERPAILPPGHVKHEQKAEAMGSDERPAILPPGYVKPQQTVDAANGTSTVAPKRRKKMKSALPDE